MKDENYEISNLTNVTGFAAGKNASADVKDVHITSGVPIQHPQANEVKAKLDELQEALEKSTLPEFKKRDALNSLTELTKELEKEVTPERQEGMRYYLTKFIDIAENVKPLVGIATSLAKLLGLPI